MLSSDPRCLALLDWAVHREGLMLRAATAWELPPICPSWALVPSPFSGGSEVRSTACSSSTGRCPRWLGPVREGSFTPFLMPTSPPCTEDHWLLPATPSLAADLWATPLHPVHYLDVPSPIHSSALPPTPPSQSCPAKSRDLAQSPPHHTPHCCLPRTTAMASSGHLSPTFAQPLSPSGCFPQGSPFRYTCGLGEREQCDTE